MSFEIRDDDARMRRAQETAQRLRTALVHLGIPATELIHVHGRTFVDARPDDVYVGPLTLDSVERLLAGIGAVGTHPIVP
jgi:hypothetical protein